MLEAVVLAGGLGTRLREVVPDAPKPMAPVAGHPFLELVLRSLARQGFGRVILSVGFRAKQVSSHFGTEFCGVEIAYAVEKEPLGTGGGVRLALSECSQDHVHILNGDTFLETEVDELERRWKQSGHPMIVAREVADTSRYGRLITADGRVTGFGKKKVGGPGLVNAGWYVFAQGQLDSFPLNSTFSLEDDYLASAVEETVVEVFVTSGRFIDIGVPEDYERAQTELADLC